MHGVEKGAGLFCTELIAELASMLHEIIVDTVSLEPDMEVVGAVERGASLSRELDGTGATIGFFRTRNEDGAAQSALLARDASAPAIVVEGANGREAILHVALGEISPRRLSNPRRAPV